MIRAGKYTHGDAVSGAIAFVATLGGWPSAMSVPNTVISCQYRNPIHASIRNDWRASWTTKFPGIAVTFPDIDTTVEVFLKRSTWISPGIRSPEHLADAMCRMRDLWYETTASAPSSSSSSA